MPKLVVKRSAEVTARSLNSFLLPDNVSSALSPIPIMIKVLNARFHLIDF